MASRSRFLSDIDVMEDSGTFVDDLGRQLLDKFASEPSHPEPLRNRGSDYWLPAALDR